MVLTKLEAVMKEKGISPEALSTMDVSSMTIRRAIKGRGIDRLKARELARLLKVKLEDLA